jgi:putative ABC transport system ATP-binding protein
MKPVIVDNVTKTYRQGDRLIKALEGVSLQIEPGRFVAVMGASGSGKSTLLHLMAGLAAPDSGQIEIGGIDITKMSDRQLTIFRRRQIGLVFQSFNLIPSLTARENIALPLQLENRNGVDLEKKIDHILGILGIAHRAEHRPDVMSGGEQQRVAIGRAIITDPAVILADEPTGNLDSVNSKEVCQLLRDLSQVNGKTIVMVTHEPSVAIYAQEALVMRDGKIVDQFDTQTVGSVGDLAVRCQKSLNNHNGGNHVNRER